MPNLNNEQPFFDAEATLSSSATFTEFLGVQVVKLESANTCIPYTIRTGEQSLGNPLERKRFNHVEIHGNGAGNARVRIYIDKRYVCDGNASFTETSSTTRKVNIPLSRSVGYTIDIEMACTGKIRGMEISYDPVGES